MTLSGYIAVITFYTFHFGHEADPPLQACPAPVRSVLGQDAEYGHPIQCLPFFFSL